jgi:hypothetical protein
VISPLNELNLLQKKMKLLAIAAFLTIFAVLRPVTAPAQQVNICDDEAKWPPYTYFQRETVKLTPQNPRCSY